MDLRDMTRTTNSNEKWMTFTPFIIYCIAKLNYVTHALSDLNGQNNKIFSLINKFEIE